MHRLPAFHSHRPESDIVAAVDLGSNSFHLIVARITNGQVHILDRLREMVRLGAGLDDNNRLSLESQHNALECLARFGQRLRGIATENVRVVGTNTLRVAVNATEFLEAAEKAIGHPIAVIAGREEARLIYLGVAHTLASTPEMRLVIDIGGGSTEFIIGKQFESLYRESLKVGCVSLSRRYFADGSIRAKAMRRAEITTLLEIQPIEMEFRKAGWDVAVGASGTLRNVGRVITEMGWDREITFNGLQRLRQMLLDAGHVSQLKSLKGLNPQRAAVFPGGVSVLLGIFEGLNVERMTVSDGALREGLVYDLLGRISHEDVRERTIQSLSHRYLIDTAQAERVENTALSLLSQVAQTWGLANEEYANMLSWAARLHEIGLSIAHEQHHKHGAYLLTYSDLAGFSRSEQALLATLVKAHRRKFPQDIYQGSLHLTALQLLRLCVLLRLAVLLHRSRHPQPLPEIIARATPGSLWLRFPYQWLDQHPLTQADLEVEREYLSEVRLQLLWG